MMYLFFYVLLVSFCFISVFTLKGQRPIVGFFFLGLALFAGARYDTGTDFQSYLSIWRSVPPLGKVLTQGFDLGPAYLEPGFLVSLSALKVISEESIVFFFAYAAATLAIVYAGAARTGVNLYVTAFIFYSIFYVPYAFNGMRQAVAMAVFLYSVRWMVEQRTALLLFASLVAAAFHFSGLFIALTYFASRLRLTAVAFSALLIPVALLLHYSGALMATFELFFPVKAAVYSTEHANDGSIFSLIARFVLFLVLLYFAFCFREDQLYRVAFFSYSIGFCAYVIFFDYGLMATRINMFFRIMEVLLFSLVAARSRLAIRVLVILFVIMYGTYGFLVAVLHPDNMYQSVFSWP